MIDKPSDLDEPFWVDTAAMLAHRTSAEALGLAMSLLVEVWAPSRHPFAYDPDELARVITAAGVTAADFTRLRDQVATYFTIREDGRWWPNPMFFRFVEPGEEAHH